MQYLRELLKKEELKVFCDDLSSLIPIRNFNLPLSLRKIISRFDFLLWAYLNKVPSNKFCFDINKLDPENDVVFIWGTVNSIFEEDELTNASPLHNFSGKKIVHLNHYFINSSKIAKNISKLENCILSAEADLSKNSFYQKHFSKFPQNYLLPFAYKKRFHAKKAFTERKNLCLALGTYLEMDRDDASYQDYIEHFDMTALHPMRKTIYQHRKDICAEIDSIISKQPFEEDEEKNKKAQEAKGISFYLLKLFSQEQKKYLSLDIVDTFNDYKMVVSPEEAIGLPSINFVESMACGCAYIGIDHDIYYDLGMKAGRDFISYDGSLKDLREKIKYYQKHQDELETIAQNGYQFAQENFFEDKVGENFYQDLQKLIKTGKLESSFKAGAKTNND